MHSTTLDVGTKCVLLLPKNIVTATKVPAKGLVTNVFLDNNLLVLVEQVALISVDPLKIMWREVPSLAFEKDYIMLPIASKEVSKCSTKNVEIVIGKAFTEIINKN